MGAAESTQCANYDILQKDEQFFSPFSWELHHAKNKTDGSFVSIFKTSAKSACISNGYLLKSLFDYVDSKRSRCFDIHVF